jgi:uncharacterized protein (TIGR02996 family)
MPRRSNSPAVAARPEVLAFLHHIKEQPHDDTPRLILSDWLEEHGGPADQARAEFIRLQCQLAHLPPDDPQVKGLLSRVGALYREHRDAWLPFHLLKGRERAWSHRGLLSIAVRGQSFASRRGLAPAGTEAYAWVDGLRFLSVTPRALATLASTSLLGGLNTLSLDDCPLRGAGVSALAESPYLNQLTTLDLHHCWIEDEGAAALTKARSSRLRRLDLYHNLLGSRGIQKLAGWRGLATVESLNLAVNVFDARGVRALAESPYLGSLRSLDLQNCFIGDEGVAVLAEAPFLDHLTELNVVFNKLSDAGAAALARSPYLSRIQRLRVGSDHLSPAGWALLRERFGAALNG